MGCSSAPESCVRAAESLARSQQVEQVFLSVLLNESSPEYALQYSKLSLSHRFLAEVGLDDFKGQYERLQSAPFSSAFSLLRQMIQNLKSLNPNLKFGITFYEDEFSSSLVKDPKLPRDVRQKVDYVHLYLHYRANAVHYESYVRQAKDLFPNARVIAGAYAYDRIDYLPCSPSSSKPCSREEEISLFKKALEIQARLVKEGAVDLIEFYPDCFGLEEQWSGWERPRVCSADRKLQCVENTKKMRQEALEIFKGTLDEESLRGVGASRRATVKPRP